MFVGFGSYIITLNCIRFRFRHQFFSVDFEKGLNENCISNQLYINSFIRKYTSNCPQSSILLSNIEILNIYGYFGIKAIRICQIL